MTLPITPDSASAVAHIIGQAVAPVFLLAGIGLGQMLNLGRSGSVSRRAPSRSAAAIALSTDTAGVIIPSP